MMMPRICMFVVALSTFIGSTLIECQAVTHGAQSSKSPVIKKKKGQTSCPPHTHDCSPNSWCCIKPSVCIRGGCSPL
jgi:hypothetical protein